jgi:plasmid stability protein
MDQELKKPRDLQNVTISMDRELLRDVRVRAAEADISVSGFVSEILRDSLSRKGSYEAAYRAWRKLKATNISSGKPYPKRDQLYDRHRPR